jgi:glycosyltransferase involved in cell wall biosynthesis
MRILMLTEARTVHAQRWARALLGRGWEVAMLSVSTKPIPGAEVIGLQIPAFGWSYPRRWWGRYGQYLRETISRVNPDVVHIHYLTDYPLEGFPQSGACWGSRPPLVISTWGADVVQDQWVPHDSSEQRRRKVKLLQAADAVTATTYYLAGCTAEYGVIPRDEITVIPFGVDLERYSAGPVNASGAGPVVGFIKHLEGKYGVEYLVRAVPEVVERIPTARFVVIGTGSQGAALKRLSGELGVGGHIEWRGAVDHAEVPAALAEMEVFAMPSVSLSETFGVSAIEAQAAGVPVVFSDLPGVREAVTDGVGGLSVPPGDVGALAGAICRLLADSSLRRRLGEQGRQFVHERFDFEDNVSQMEEVYRRVTAGVAGVGV